MLAVLALDALATFVCCMYCEDTPRHLTMSGLQSKVRTQDTDTTCMQNCNSERQRAKPKNRQRQQTHIKHEAPSTLSATQARSMR